jgi:hypothetical protein
LYGTGGEGYEWIFRKMLKMEDQIPLIRLFVPQVKSILF